jgi:hypothetical protein
MFTLQSIIYIFKIQSYIMHAQARMRIYACFSLVERVLLMRILNVVMSAVEVETSTE